MDSRTRSTLSRVTRGSVDVARLFLVPFDLVHIAILERRLARLKKREDLAARERSR